MKLEYDLSEQDYMAFNMHYIKYSKRIRSSLFVQRYLISLIFLVIPFVTGGAKYISLGGSLALAVVIYVLWVVFYPKYFNGALKKRVTKILNQGNNKSLLGRRTMSLGEDGISEMGNYGDGKIPWDSIKKVEETNEHIFVYINDVNAYVIPIRAFKNEDDKKKFLDAIGEHCKEYKKY